MPKHLAMKYEYNQNVYSVDADTLGETALDYLVEYGWKQSMGDSIAGRAKKTAETETLRFAKLDFKVDNPTADQLDTAATTHASDIEAAVKQELHAILTKRRDAIQAGSIQVGGGGQRNPYETLCWNIAAEMVVAAFIDKTGKKPKKDDAFDTLVDNALVKYRADVEKEAEARQKRVAKIKIEI